MQTPPAITGLTEVWLAAVFRFKASQLARLRSTLAMDSKRLRPVCQGISYSRASSGEVREVPVPATLGRSRRSLSLCSKVATEVAWLAVMLDNPPF